MMKTRTAVDLNSITQTSSLAELRLLVSKISAALTLPQAHQIAAHAQKLAQETVSLRLAVVHTYTSDLLDPWLNLQAALQGISLNTYHAPYGMTFQEAGNDSGLVKHTPDITWFMLRREDLHPDLVHPLSALNPAQQEELLQAALAALMNLLGQFKNFPVGQMVLTLLPELTSPGLGIFDAQSERSEVAWWARLKSEIAAKFRDLFAATLFLDLDDVLLQLGRENFFDYRLWYSCRFPFKAGAAQEIARRLISLGAVIKLPKAKVIVLDADNTLWGGIIGEDGLSGIALGPDYPGNAFVDFQRRLLKLQQRGFILALCSKNNPADLDQVLQEHPHQILRDHHFAARRVNWEPKPENLLSMAKELNLGLESFIFVDDSSHECEAVRFALPQVEVIQTPARAIEVPFCLDRVARLEVLSLTAEDLAKTDMYAQERTRREFMNDLENQAAGGQNYLQSLGMEMSISLDCEAHLSRIAQLTQKTNQFNLTTRRYNEAQIAGFIADDQWLVADFSLADVFGDSGIVGLAIFSLLDGQRAELDTFLMSCRVIGREAEGAFLHALLGILATNGIQQLTAEFIPTAKNVLAKSFLVRQGFQIDNDGRYSRDLLKQEPEALTNFPISVSIKNHNNQKN